MSRPWLQTAGVFVLTGLLLAGAVEIQAAREQLYPDSEIDDESLYVTSGSRLWRAAIAYDALAADLYWIRAIQYFGGTKRALEDESRKPEPPPLLAADTSGYPLLYPLLDLTTTLDPRFKVAYRFGAIFLAEPYPGGPGRPDLAEALLQKGLHERPDKWEYMQDIGFVHYWWLHDYTTAASWFDKAAHVPGSPWWLRSLAATTLAQGGDRSSSRKMWESIRQSAEIDWLRAASERALDQLQVLDDIDSLQATVDAYVKREGTAPQDWASLVRARAIPGFPLDPTGTPYIFDANGRVQPSDQSPLLPLPQEPRRIGGGS